MPTTRDQEKSHKLGNHEIYLAEESDLPERSIFTGRETELMMCRIAWGLDENYKFIDGGNSNSLAFRLFGKPGMGKNELVYELVRKIREKNPKFSDMPFYSMVGHDEMSPEDMVLAVVPTETTHDSRVNMVLRASPLATAILKGGIFFFDELNRLPERALAPLSSALDGRGQLYAASSGLWLRPREDARPFRFCCALNPSVGADLPGYIDQRTLPKLAVSYPGHEKLVELLQNQLTADLHKEHKKSQKKGKVASQIERMEDQVAEMSRFLKSNKKEPSVRQGLTIIRLARALLQNKYKNFNFDECLQEAFERVFEEKREDK